MAFVILAILTTFPVVVTLVGHGKFTRWILIAASVGLAVNAMAYYALAYPQNQCNNKQLLCGAAFYLFWCYVVLYILNLGLVGLMWRRAFMESTASAKVNLGFRITGGVVAFGLLGGVIAAAAVIIWVMITLGIPF